MRGLEVAYSALLVQAWVPPFHWALNGPGWFVSNLALFYLVVPWWSAAARRLHDARAAAAIADDGVRRTLGAFAEASRRRSTPEANIREGDDDVSHDGGEDDDLSRGEASRRADDFLRDVSAEDESAVLAAVARAVEVLIASGDADARAVALALRAARRVAR